MPVTKTVRLWWIVLAFVSGIATAMFAEELILRVQGNRLEFSAPRLHYVTDGPLKRLHNAESVAYEFNLTLATGARTNVVRQYPARFVISYDLWEEKFSVTKTTPNRKTAGHMTAAQVETWCVQEMAVVDLNGVVATQPLWVRLEVRAEDESETRLFGRGNITDAGISLTSLIERFSRPPRGTQQPWIAESAPVTLEQLRRGG
ncbi:MAG: hypothetical protein ABI811_05325 [Acidobacteriota bacterium]